MGRTLLAVVLPLLLARCTGDITTREDGTVTRRDRGAGRDGQGGGDDAQGGTCSQGMFLDGYCYFTAGLGQMDYATAKPLCAAVAGGKPASIHSDEENKLIFSLLLSIRSGVWIGLVRGSGDKFKWEDGSPLSYTNWASGEPDNDDCAILVGPFGDQGKREQWADTRCSRRYSEIACKYKP